nr:DNA polymerase IV [Nocardia donostiensis]
MVSDQHPASGAAWVIGGTEPEYEETSRRWVLHIDMDAFFASCEQLTRPTLRGRPVLVGGTGGRGVVAGASYEARVFGARSAMPMHQARRLVGMSAVVVPPRGTVYGELSTQVFQTLRARIPVLETLSFDEAFGEPAELAGASTERVRAFCEQLRADVRASTGLVASVGAGTGKQLAKIASGLAKPDGVRVVSPGEQHALLSALPVRKLWGIGPVAESRLRSLGIDTVGAFAALPETEAVSILGGSIGAVLHRLARGIDDRPVTERAEAKQISAETTYEHDLVTMAQLRPAIEQMAAAAHRRLSRDGRAARTVVLKLKRSDMSIVTRSTTLPYATEDLAALTAAAQRCAMDPEQLGPIRLVGVGYTGLSTVRQESLFPELAMAGPAGGAGADDESASTFRDDLGDAADRTGRSVRSPDRAADTPEAGAQPTAGSGRGGAANSTNRTGGRAPDPVPRGTAGNSVADTVARHGDGGAGWSIRSSDSSHQEPIAGQGSSDGAAASEVGEPGQAAGRVQGPRGRASFARDGEDIGGNAAVPEDVAIRRTGRNDGPNLGTFTRPDAMSAGRAAVRDAGEAVGRGGEPAQVDWRPGTDVRHTEYGHGWVQGAGYGVVTVRFETRSTGPGPARTFAADDSELARADPLDSLR